MERRLHRHHHLVVVSVVTTFHLDDLVSTCCRTRDADRIHRRFSSRVGEAPHRQAVSLGEHLGHLGVAFARGDEQRAITQLRLDCGLDRGVTVTDEQGAEAHVVVGVAIAVDVLHPRTLGAAHHQRVRVVGLETGRDSEREHLAGSGVGSLRASCAIGVGRQLSGRDLFGSESQ